MSTRHQQLHRYFGEVLRAIGNSRPFPKGTPVATVQALRALGLTVRCVNKSFGHCEGQRCDICNGYGEREAI